MQLARRLQCKFKLKLKPNLTVLNVAEKNDAAKRVSQIMSNGNSHRREGKDSQNLTRFMNLIITSLIVIAR